MTTHSAQMQSYYACRAPEYDGVYLKPERQQDLRAIERWLPPLFSGSSVLEIACGTGYWTQFIAPVALNIVALDSSVETMRVAQSRMPGHEHKVTFQQGDAYRLAPDLGRFNAAFAGFWFSHVPKTKRRDFLCDLNVVLQPGAKVVLLDNLFVEGSSTAISETDVAGDTYQMRRLNDGSTYRVLKNFPSESELTASIAGLGVQQKFTTWQHFWAFEYVVVSD
jgi:ubiquinone/menaquinone biosynthesis C-methylase UbiE